MTVAETPTKNSSGLNRMSPALTGSSESVSSNPGGGGGGGGGSAGAQMQLQQQSQVSCDRQFVTIVSEKQARVVALPSQNCVYKYQISDADFVVKSEVISMKGTWSAGGSTPSFSSLSPTRSCPFQRARRDASGPRVVQYVRPSNARIVRRVCR